MTSSNDPFAGLGFDVEVSGGNSSPPVSRGTSIRNALPKGLYKGAQALIQSYPMIPKGPVSAEIGNKLVEQFLPTQDKLTENILERGGKLLPQVIGPGQLVKKAVAVGAGTLGGQLAKAMGFGETGQNIAELGAMLGPDAVRGLSKFFTAPKIPMKSGLSTPKAIDSKHAELATITPERRKEALGALNKEASQIAETTLKAHVPLIDKIRDGHDFQADFSRDFGEVNRLAAAANPTINVKPMRDLLRDTIQKYDTIPLLHKDAAKVMKEVKAFAKAKDVNPNTGLDQLIKIRRSNTKKMKDIYEKRFVKGTQSEYVDFLDDMNKSIDESIRQTLPADSQFVKLHEQANKDYSNFLNAKKAESSLKPILGGKPKPSNIAQLANDPDKIKRLSLYMGKQGAEDISQLAKDLSKASDSIKNIPVKTLTGMDKILPLALLLDISKIPKALVVGPKVLKGARSIYGSILASPQRVSAYRDALKALTSGDMAAYRKAAQTLMEELGETIQPPKKGEEQSESVDFSDLGFEAD